MCPLATQAAKFPCAVHSPNVTGARVAAAALPVNSSPAVATAGSNMASHREIFLVILLPLQESTYMPLQ